MIPNKIRDSVNEKRNVNEAVDEQNKIRES